MGCHKNKQIQGTPAEFKIPLMGPENGEARNTEEEDKTQED